jgi:hypothetical protein
MLGHGPSQSQSQGNSWADVGCLVGLRCDSGRDLVRDAFLAKPLSTRCVKGQPHYKLPPSRVHCIVTMSLTAGKLEVVRSRYFFITSSKEHALLIHFNHWLPISQASRSV